MNIEKELASLNAEFGGQKQQEDNKPSAESSPEKVDEKKIAGQKNARAWAEAAYAEAYGGVIEDLKKEGRDYGQMSYGGFHGLVRERIEPKIKELESGEELLKLASIQTRLVWAGEPSDAVAAGEFTYIPSDFTVPLSWDYKNIEAARSFLTQEQDAMLDKKLEEKAAEVKSRFDAAQKYIQEHGSQYDKPWVSIEEFINSRKDGSTNAYKNALIFTGEWSED